MHNTARNESWNDMVKRADGSHMQMRNAANKSELSQNPFLPMRSPRRKTLIMMNDLKAGMLAPEMKRYMSMNGREASAATCDGVR